MHWWIVIIYRFNYGIMYKLLHSDLWCMCYVFWCHHTKLKHHLQHWNKEVITLRAIMNLKSNKFNFIIRCCKWTNLIVTSLRKFPEHGNTTATLCANFPNFGQILLSMAKVISIMTYYCKTSSISHTKSQNLNVSNLFLQLSLLNPLKPGGKSRMKM